MFILIANSVAMIIVILLAVYSIRSIILKQTEPGWWNISFMLALITVIALPSPSKEYSYDWYVALLIMYVFTIFVHIAFRIYDIGQIKKRGREDRQRIHDEFKKIREDMTSNMFKHDPDLREDKDAEDLSEIFKGEHNE